jgi:divalent anion:Na+ symporter, DASS family
LRLSKRSLGAAAAIAVAALIRLQPAIGPLDPVGRSALAIIAMAVILWIADTLNVGITAILTLGLLIVAGVPSGVALSGFATGAFWILVSVLFFGTAMERTGLARRIAYRILLFFPPTFGGISCAFMLIGFVLTLGVPSMTVRTAIMVPIAFALVQAIKLPMPSRGSALIVLGAFEMAVLPGCAVLTGSLFGPFIAGLFANASLPISWLEYARVLTIPTIIWCGLIVAVNFFVTRPEPAPGMSRDIVRTEMKQLGPIRGAELTTAGIIALAVIAWAVQPWHRVPPEAIGMVALAAIFAAAILAPPDIGTGIPWALAIFVGGMLSLTTVMSTYKINAWIGSYIVPGMQPFAHNIWLLVLAMAVGVALMRFIDPIGFMTLAAFILSLAAFSTARGIPPLVLTAVVLLPIHVFWFNYQNIWLAMTDGITKRSAFSEGQRLALASAFFGTTLVALGLSVWYWRWMGIIGW